MTDRKYAVAFGGELIEGVTAAGVRERLARTWPSLPGAQIDTLMGSRNATLKLFAERDVADQFVGFMRQAGMVCWLRLLRPGEETSPMLAELDWSATDSVGLLAARMAPPSATAPAVRRVALGPKAMTAVIALAACAAVAYWVIEPAPKRRHLAAASTAQPVDASTATPEAPAVAAETGVAPATLPPAGKTLMVPEPILVSARAERAALKESAPIPTAEAAKMESAATSERAPATSAHTPPVVFAPAAAPQTLAMNQPAASVTPAPIAKPAEVITAPTYDRAKVPQPRYPVQAYRNREQGEVLLQVLVGADGKPKKVTIDRTSGSGLLDRAAVDAVKGWTFTPGTRNGVAREAARQVAVGFKLDE